MENNNLKEFLKLKKNKKCNLISHQIALGHLKSNINWKKDNEKEIEDSTSNVTDEHLDSDDSDSETDDEEGDIVISCAEEDCSSSSEESNDDDDDGSNTDCIDTDSDFCTTEDENEDDHDVSNLFTTTRSGRSTTTRRCSYFKCKYINKQICLSHCPSVIFAVIVYL